MMSWARFSPIPFSEVNSSFVAVFIFTAASAMPYMANQITQASTHFFIKSSFFYKLTGSLSVRRTISSRHSIRLPVEREVQLLTWKRVIADMDLGCQVEWYEAKIAKVET